MSTSLLLLQISFALIVGLLMTRAFKYLKINLPDVTAYLISGIIIGPYVIGKLGIDGFGLISMDEVERLSVISDVALGFIAFDIGNEFKLEELKKIGKKATIIGIAQAIITTVIVDVVLVSFALATNQQHLTLIGAIILGAIASATAPAATLMVVRQYKAQGKITDLLLPIVAIDDVVGLIIFSASFGVSQAMISGQLTVISMVIEPLLEIVLSIALGFVLGLILSLLEKMFFSNTNRLSLSIGFVLLSITLSKVTFSLGGVHIGFSPLLVNMMLGTTLCNLCPAANDIMYRCEKWTAPIYALFFVLSGAELELSVFANYMMIVIGALYIISRCLGKYFGAYASSKVCGCDKITSKFLGITLFPQAGVALGMCNSASALGSEHAVVIRNIVLLSVMIYELVGPALTTMSLRKAGEINPK